MAKWLKIWAFDLCVHVKLWLVAGHFSFFSLESTPKNEEVFYHILRRGCKAVGPEGQKVPYRQNFQGRKHSQFWRYPRNVFSTKFHRAVPTYDRLQHSAKWSLLTDP